MGMIIPRRPCKSGNKSDKESDNKSDSISVAEIALAADLISDGGDSGVSCGGGD